MLGVILTLAYGPRPTDGAIHIRVVSLVEKASGFRCRWELSAAGTWIEQESRSGPSGGQLIILHREQQPWFSLHRPSPNLIHLEVDVNRSLPKPDITYGSESVQVSVNSATSSSSSGGSHMVKTGDANRVSKVLVRTDTALHPPGSIVLATVGGEPVTLEFRK